jgi:hypothetical protein
MNITPAQSACISDLHDLYKRRVPRMFYDYCETGSYSASTFNDNTEAFAKYKLRQRVARNISGRNLKTNARRRGDDAGGIGPRGFNRHAACRW